MTARVVIWSMVAFLAFGALFFVAVAGTILRAWWRDRRALRRRGHRLDVQPLRGIRR